MFRSKNVMALLAANAACFLPGQAAFARGTYKPRVKMAAPPKESGKPSLQNLRAAIYSAVREGLPLCAGNVSHITFNKQQEVVLDRYAGPPIPEMRLEGVVSFEPAYEPARRMYYRTRVRWEGHPDHWRILILEIGNTIFVREAVHPRPVNAVLAELQGSLHDIGVLREELRQRLEMEVSLEEWKPQGLAHQQEREELLHKFEREQAPAEDLQMLRQEVAEIQAQRVKAEVDRIAVRSRREWLEGELARRREHMLSFLLTGRGKPQVRAALGSAWLRDEQARWAKWGVAGGAAEPSAPSIRSDDGHVPSVGLGTGAATAGSAAEAQQKARKDEERWYRDLQVAVLDVHSGGAASPKQR